MIQELKSEVEKGGVGRVNLRNHFKYQDPWEIKSYRDSYDSIQEEIHMYKHSSDDTPIINARTLTNDDLPNIRISQEYCIAAKLRNMVGSKDMISVIQYEELLIVEDGHHRLLANLLSSDDDLNLIAHIIKLK